MKMKMLHECLHPGHPLLSLSFSSFLPRPLLAAAARLSTRGGEHARARRVRCTLPERARREGRMRRAHAARPLGRVGWQSWRWGQQWWWRWGQRSRRW